MLSEDIQQLANSIGEIAGKVDESAWEHLHIIRDNLRSIAEQVRQLEAHFVPRFEDAKGGADGRDYF